MTTKPEFDDLRPYYDNEIPAAMNRIADGELFPLLSEFVYPHQDIEKVRLMVRGFKTAREFQEEVMFHMNAQVVARSITELTFSGFEHLSPTQSYLFVSNHRDIVLDASLLQYLLVQQGYKTSEITFGENLMCNQLVIDIGKSNKMFKVVRASTPKDFYRCSKHLSDYIRYTLCEKHESVWIAQRNGRTKDGDDATDQGIVKMFGMSGGSDKVAALDDLHILPVAIAYEWEPCDILKALELYTSRFQKYVKKPGEDLNSILTGILQPKGRVHIALCEPIERAELEAFQHEASNVYDRKVASLIDSRIRSHYQLCANNYIAHDLRSHTDTYAAHYTPEQKAAFLHHLQKLETYDIESPELLKDILLGIYANSVRE